MGSLARKHGERHVRRGWGAMILPAIVLYQPYAWAMFHGKDVENRKRPWKYRGPVLILAAKNTPGQYYLGAISECKTRGLEPPKDLEFGGIVGAVELWDLQPPSWVVPPQLAPYQNLKWHFPEQWGWLCRRPVELPFRAYRGSRGIMKIELTETETRLLTDAGLVNAQIT